MSVTAFRIGRQIRKLLYRMPIPYFYQVDYIHNFFKFSRWMKTREKELAHSFAERPELFAYINNEVLGGAAVDYFEFGVSDGSSIRMWLENNTCPESRFFGFDTFEGLPEAYINPLYSCPPGTFSTQGRTPDLNDPRVTFIKGLIQDTLPHFLASHSPSNKLVINVDVDLYTASLFILTTMDKYLQGGAIVLFDEFSVPMHEFRAFVDYTTAFMKSYTLIASANDCFARMAVSFT